MKCPDCSTALRAVTYEGVSVRTCDNCGGEFIGPAELRSIVTVRESVFGNELRALLADHNPMFGSPAGEDDRCMSCPACEGPMQMVNYSGDSGIAVDRCNDCGGTWLDHDELEKIQVIMEHWQDHAPVKLHQIADKLEIARQKAAARTSNTFAGSRFAFVNALINRLLDAA